MHNPDDPAQPCDRCGAVHRWCAGHRKRDGGPCGRRPRLGSAVCHGCGGAAGQVIRAAERRVERAQAEADALTFGVPEGVDPAEAITREIAALAGSVTWLRARVAALDPDALVWGVAKRRAGMTPAGPVDLTEHRAQVHVLVQLLGQQQDRLIRASDVAIRLGVEERRVRLAEGQGRVLADVLRGALDDVGVDGETLAAASAAIARRMRAVAADVGDI